MAQGPDEKQESLADKVQSALAQRVGGCNAIVCSYGCNAYAYTRSENGFHLCICGHTQNVHAKGAVE